MKKYLLPFLVCLSSFGQPSQSIQLMPVVGAGSTSGGLTPGSGGSNNNFTNATLWTSGNSQAAVQITNYSGTTIGVVLNGISATNAAPGFFINDDGGVGQTVSFEAVFNHDGSGFNGVEAATLAGGNIALIPGRSGGLVRGIQMGGNGNPTYVYFNTASNLNAGNHTPSQFTYWAAANNSNDITIYGSSPGFVNLWETTNATSRFVMFYNSSTNLDNLPLNYTPNTFPRAMEAYCGVTNSDWFAGLRLTSYMGPTGSNVLELNTNGALQFSGVGVFTNGISTSSTNWSNALSVNGYTNTTGRNQQLNVQGTSGSYVFYMRGGQIGQTAAATPIWTNTIIAGGDPVFLGDRCGVQITSPVGVVLKVNDL